MYQPRVVLKRNGYFRSADGKYNLYYELSGNGDEKVILSHGLNGSMNDFAYLIRSLFLLII
jgi:alpha-beta hydrolase superfamily lysophospholipase